MVLPLAGYKKAPVNCAKKVIGTRLPESCAAQVGSGATIMANGAAPENEVSEISIGDPVTGATSLATGAERTKTDTGVIETGNTQLENHT